TNCKSKWYYCNLEIFIHTANYFTSYHALESSAESPAEKFDGSMNYCLYRGKVISHDTCHYMCLKLQNPYIVGGLCLSNVCFCEWNVPHKFYKTTYASLKASERVKIVTNDGIVAASYFDEELEQLEPDLSHTSAAQSGPSCSK
ncbi:hypothetical protein QAD02_015941, partial [Eretmocerus hayati]